MTKKPMFDFVIGNPPYQETRENTSDMPIYHEFLEAAYRCAHVVETITPGRFLFNAGSTPKEWNRKMLHDEHLKVLMFEQDSSKIFPSTDIKGGVAVTMRNDAVVFGAIKQFSPFPALSSIATKMNTYSYTSISEIMYSQCAYGITDIFHQENPSESQRLKPSARKFFASNVFDTLTDAVFTDTKPSNSQEEYVQLIGRTGHCRAYKWIKKKYVQDPGNLMAYKVILPNSNGSGAIGEVLSTPLVGVPLVGHTQTFISIGCFENLQDAEACCKYIKTKFTRALLGILKITQHNTPEKWEYVPLQDFTEHSDIDWSQSVADIDKQLYTKYGLSQDEIDFIESHVKEME